MKKIVLLLSSVYLLFAGTLFDKTYMYVGTNTQDKDKKEFSKFETKVLFEKNIDITDDSKFIFDVIAGYNIDNKNVNNSSFRISQAYYEKFWFEDIMSMSLGRIEKDFRYSKTYDILNFLNSSGTIEDMDDRYLISGSVDGISITLNDPYSTSPRYLALHAYVDDITTKEGIRNAKLVFEATKIADASKGSIFVNKNSDKNIAIALAQTTSIGDKFNYNSMIQYQHSDVFTKGIFSSVGIEYSPVSSFLIGSSFIDLGDGLKSNKERQNKYAELNDEDKIKKMYNDLTSKYYISSFAKHQITNNFSYIISGLYNMNDSSIRASAQVEYEYKNLKFFVQHISHMGDKWSEFGEIKEHGFANKTRFLISYLILD